MNEPLDTFNETIRESAKRAATASREQKRAVSDLTRALAELFRSLDIDARVVCRGYATGREIIEISLYPQGPTAHDQDQAGASHEH